MPENPLGMINVPQSINQGARETRLPKPLRAEMEKTYDTDFSSVRFMESHVPTLNGSRSYATSPNEIHFAPGQFDPHTEGGRQLIGHELAHVVQQRGGREAAVNAPLIQEAANNNSSDNNE